jgi:UDP-2,3-diacylglucosamine hydrolase
VPGMKAIFLADAHLRQPEDRNYQRLLEFLDQQQDLDALFLLGDIFEFWLGYKHLTFTAYIPLLDKLRRLTETGTKIYFVEGNHDFHLGPYFTETLGGTVIPDQQLINWDGKKILLCHGDLLNPNPNYQRLRSLWRSGLIRFLSKIVHPDPVWAFGIWLSNMSKKRHPKSHSWDPTSLLLPFAKEEFAKGADIVACGHFHQPLDKRIEDKQLIAVGDWIGQFSYAEMNDGEISLKTYSD